MTRRSRIAQPPLIVSTTESLKHVHVKRFSDGFRVWHPLVRNYVGDRTMAPFATMQNAAHRAREIELEVLTSGGAPSDGPSRSTAPRVDPRQGGLKFNGIDIPIRTDIDRLRRVARGRTFGITEHPNRARLPLDAIVDRVVIGRFATYPEARSAIERHLATTAKLNSFYSGGSYDPDDPRPARRASHQHGHHGDAMPIGRAVAYEEAQHHRAPRAPSYDYDAISALKPNPFVVAGHRDRPALDVVFSKRDEAGLAQRYLEGAQGATGLRVRAATPAEIARMVKENARPVDTATLNLFAWQPRPLSPPPVAHVAPTVPAPRRRGGKVESRPVWMQVFDAAPEPQPLPVAPPPPPREVERHPAPPGALRDFIVASATELGLSPRMVDELHQAITEGVWSGYLHPDNKGSREVFRAITGVKLPSTLRKSQELFVARPFPIAADLAAGPSFVDVVPMSDAWRPVPGFRAIVPDKSLRASQAAELIRQEAKRAMRHGALPRGIEVSANGSGSVIDVEVTKLPGVWAIDPRGTAEPGVPARVAVDITAPSGEAVLTVLEAIVRAINVNQWHTSVNFASDLVHYQRVLRKKMRARKPNGGRGRTLPATVERCVAHVGPRRVEELGPREGLSSAIAICTAQGQRLGQLRKGTRKPTKKGRRDQRNARRRVGFTAAERAVSRMAKDARKSNGMRDVVAVRVGDFVTASAKAGPDTWSVNYDERLERGDVYLNGERVGGVAGPEAHGGGSFDFGDYYADVGGEEFNSEFDAFRFHLAKAMLNLGKRTSDRVPRPIDPMPPIDRWSRSTDGQRIFLRWEGDAFDADGDFTRLSYAIDAEGPDGRRVEGQVSRGDDDPTPLAQFNGTVREVSDALRAWHEKAMVG